MVQVLITKPPVITSAEKTSCLSERNRYNLQEAIKTGNFEQFDYAVKTQKISVHDPLPNGELPLCFAAKLDLPDMTQKLMDLGASPCQKDASGYTAVEHAAFLKREKSFPLLIRETVKLQIADVNREYPKMRGWARMLSKHCEHLARSTPVSGKGSDLSGLQRAAFSGDLQTLRTFKGDVDAMDKNGLTAMHYALLGKAGSDAVEILISKGANLHFVSRTGETYLHFVALTGKTDCVSKLCEHGLKVSKTNDFLQSPLHYATAHTGNPEYWNMYDALVQSGAKVSEKDTNGLSPFHMIKAYSEAKNPNGVSLSDWILLFSALGFWGTYLASETGYVPVEHWLTAHYMAAVSLALHSLTLLVKIMNNKTLSCYLGCALGVNLFNMNELIPFIQTALGCEKVAKSAFYSWTNRKYQGWMGLRNFAVHASNLAASLGAIAFKAEIIPVGFDPWSAFRNQKSPVPPPEDWQSLSEKERILHEGLAPDKPSDAEKILHCSTAKLEKYPTNAEWRAFKQEMLCKDYKACIKREHKAQCDLHDLRTYTTKDTPEYEEFDREYKECLKEPRPVILDLCQEKEYLKHGYSYRDLSRFDPGQCLKHAEATSKVSSAYESVNAYRSALKKCYRELALRWHPDKTPDADAPEVFHRIKEAHKTLANNLSVKG